MYERKNQKPASLRIVFTRLGWNFLIGVGLIAISTFIGMIGYHYLAELTWLDSFLNSSMILSGMGPVDHLSTSSAKIFAGIYALFCGIIFLAIIALIFAPVFHHLFHKFHFVDKE